jgi:hypothetical protein
MMRIRRRRKLSPDVLRLSKIADRTHLRARCLAEGIAAELAHCYDYDELKDLLDIMATDLQPAFKADQAAQEAYSNARSGVRKSQAAIGKKKAAKK